MNFFIGFEIPKSALKVLFFGLFLLFSIDFALHFWIFFESVRLKWVYRYDLRVEIPKAYALECILRRKKIGLPSPELISHPIEL